jgi:hypothetical protein
MIRAPVSKGKSKERTRESNRLGYPQRNIFGIRRVMMVLSKSGLHVALKEDVQRERWHIVERV